MDLLHPVIEKIWVLCLILIQLFPGGNTAVFLSNLSVVYQVPVEKISSIKEYVIKRIKRQVVYRKFHALKNINLSVQRGEIFGVLGRNGAGKSTLLKVISRVLYPTTGRVWIQGNVAPLLELGAGFHPELTGMENVFLNGTLLGHKRLEIEEKMDYILQFSEIGDFIYAPLRTYSSGMNARLGFSVATAWIPDILVLDEVLSVGDAAFQEKCEQRMKEMMESGSTILLVSHSENIIKSTCKRAILLHHGEMVGMGPIEEISESYQADFKGRMIKNQF